RVDLDDPRVVARVAGGEQVGRRRARELLAGDVLDERVVVVLQDRPHELLHLAAHVGGLEEGGGRLVEGGLGVGEHGAGTAAAPGGAVVQQVQLPGRVAHAPV